MRVTILRRSGGFRGCLAAVAVSLAVATALSGCGAGSSGDTADAGAFTGTSGSGAAASPASGPGTIAVSSAAFDEGGTIPTQFTCDGAGVSPPITWSGVPAGAASVALVVEDPDAPSRTFVHWVVAGLPGADGTLPEGAGDPRISAPHTSSTSVPPPDLAGTVSALNSAGRPGWTPPCPPSGTHHYRFTVYVLPTGPPFPAGSAAGPAVAAITAAATAHGSLTGIYARGG